MSATILNFAVQYSLYSGYTLFCLGVIGNVINILVFTQLKLFRKNNSVFYLTVEQISNIGFLIISLIATIFTSIYGDDATGRSIVWCRLRYIWVQICVMTTYSMISCVSIDQFFSTHYNFYLRQLCTLKLARCISFALVCVWIIHSIIFAMFFNIQPSIGCAITNQIYLQYAIFFVYPVLNGLLPIFIASFFSLLAFQNVRRIVRRQIPIVRRRLDRQMTAMVLIRVVWFVCLALPYSIYRVYALKSPVSRSQFMAYAIAQLLQSIFLSLIKLNYVVSFYMFMMFSARFRRQVKYVLMKKCWKQWKQWCSCQNHQVAPLTIEISGLNMELEKDI